MVSESKYAEPESGHERTNVEQEHVHVRIPKSWLYCGAVLLVVVLGTLVQSNQWLARSATLSEARVKLKEERLKLMAEVLEITPGIETERGSADLLSAIQARMSHLLQGAVRTAKNAAFSVETSIRVGDPFVLVPEEAKGCSLLIVGSHESHEDFLDSRAYELMQRVPHIPVLAL